MQTPIQITFRDVSHSDSVEQYVRARAARLDAVASRIVGCQVALEVPHKHSQHGRHYRVRISLQVPGGEVVIGNTHDDDRNEEDLYAAIDAAFDLAARRLQDYVRRQRGEVKSRPLS
jgi:ribosomal subunit interface protein